MSTSEQQQEHFCEPCNFRVSSATGWQQHLESRAHRRKGQLEDQFVLNGEDMFIEDDAPTMKLLSKMKMPLIEISEGVEHIVEDRTSDDIKCMLCRVLLKTTTLVEHLKSYKHQQLYLERLYPHLYRGIQLRSQKKGELAHLVSRQCEDLLRQYGRQKVRVYERGCAEKHVPSCFPSSSASVEEFEELPKNERVIQMLLNSELRSFAKGETAYINDVLKHVTGPVIGLEYVAEYKDPNGEFEPGYLCTCCESVLNSAQLVNHLVSDKHRLKYMGRDYKNYYSIVNFSKFTDERRKELLANYSRDIESTRGRGEVRSKLIVPPDSSFLFRYHKRIKEGKEDASSTTGRSLYSERSSTVYGPWPEDAKPSSSSPPKPAPQPVQKVVTSKFVPLPPVKFMPIPAAAPSSSHLPPTSTNYHPPPYSASSHLPTYHQSSSSSMVAQPETVAPIRSVVQPRKPTFVYSEKREAEKKIRQLEESLPPFVEKNMENGWYSERAFSVEYFFQRCGQTASSGGYLSIRCPQARADIYGDWSPFLMRKLQDQFNFELDHLAWLQGQFVRWRMPLYQPLEPTDLRPLEDEVENAVLQVLVYRSLKSNVIRQKPELFEYPTPENDVVRTKEKEFDVYDYDHKSDVPSPKKIKIDLAERVVFQPPRPSVEEKQQATTTTDDGVESSMLTICEQILNTARFSSTTTNAVLRLLLGFSNAKTVLYQVATKEPKRLQQIIAYVKNPNDEISKETLIEFEKIFQKFSAY